MITKTIVTVALLLSATSAVSGADPCDDQGRLLAITNEHGILVLCAASGRVHGADSVCVATLGRWWDSESPEHLAARTPRDSLASALGWVCRTVRALPEQQRAKTISALEAWVQAYCAVESLAGLTGSEALATAVAYVPQVADLLPRDPERRALLGREIGSSLASAEHTTLQYALAGRLAGLWHDEQAGVVRDLWAEATKD